VTTAEQVTDPIADHGETPTYDPATGLLHWVDMSAGDVLSMDVRAHRSGPITRQHVGAVAAAWRPRAGGGSIVAVENGFVITDPDGSTQVLTVFSDPLLRMNDGTCDRQGRYYCGTMAYAETPGAGTLYRLDQDRSVTPVLTGSTISNGIVWSVDGSSVYYIDTPTHRVDGFDFDADAGTLRNRHPVVMIEADAGSPDGMTIDAEGGLWVALWNGSAVHRYDVDGTLTEVITVPATQTTACAFGGPDLDRLYITTSRRDIDPAVQPLAGALFVATPGVGGIPVLTYGG
jgi:sugar lactone lactonase YvrE